MSYCQSLGQKLNDWRLAIDELKLAKDAYLANFSDPEKEIYQAKKNEAVKLQQEYAELLEQSYETIEINYQARKLFGPEYEALRRIYEGCNPGFLEQGEIKLENGRITKFSLLNLSSPKDTDAIIHSRTQAFKNVRYFKHLKNFFCSNNGLPELDVRENKELKVLRCYGNLLSELDVRENKELKELYCYWNFLINLDVGENKKLLQSIICYDNFLPLSNIQVIILPGINDQVILPQYPVEILEFLKNLKQTQPELSFEVAVKLVHDFYQSSEIQRKLSEGVLDILRDFYQGHEKIRPAEIILPDSSETKRIVKAFFS